MAGEVDHVEVTGILMYGYDGSDAYPLLCDGDGKVGSGSGSVAAKKNQCEVSGVLLYGHDGTNAYPILVDSGGQLV